MGLPAPYRGPTLALAPILREPDACRGACSWPPQPREMPLEGPGLALVWMTVWSGTNVVNSYIVLGTCWLFLLTLVCTANLLKPYESVPSLNELV